MPLIRRIFCVAPLLALVATAAAQTRWELPAAYPANNFHTENLIQFAAEVDQATAGKLKITVHPAAGLFKAPEIKRAVQGGQAPIGEILLSNFQNEWPVFGLDSLPFLADGYDAAARLAKAQRPVLEKKLAEQGMLLLYMVAWPPQGIYAKKPILSVADLKGLNWRTFGPATSRIAELVGAQPVTVPLAELSQALATGVIDSAMSSSATGVDTRTYEHLRFWTDTQAWLPKNAVLVNRTAFDALDKPVQAALLKAGSDAEARGWQLSKARNAESIELLKKNGMTIVAESPQLSGELNKLGETMLKEWLAKAGPEGYAVIGAYRHP